MFNFFMSLNIKCDGKSRNIGLPNMAPYAYDKKPLHKNGGKERNKRRGKDAVFHLEKLEFLRREF